MADNLTKVFKSFVEDIVKVFPEYENRLNTYYKDVLENEEYSGEKLTDFLNNIEEIMDRIVDQDTKLFNEDPIILQNVSFKTIWKSDITSKTRMDIWKYLQSFCIIKINMDSSKEKMDEVLKKIELNEKVRDKKTVNDMKKLKKLNESINNKELEKLFEENPEKVTESMNEMENMFENTNGPATGGCVSVVLGNAIGLCPRRHRVRSKPIDGLELEPASYSHNTDGRLPVSERP